MNQNDSRMKKKLTEVVAIVVRKCRVNCLRRELEDFLLMREVTMKT